MIDTDTVKKNLNKILVETGCFLVDVKVDRNNKIVIHIDRNEGLGIDDCALISRKLKNLLDRDKEDFALEVSSPGLDASFKVKEQYHKSIGKKIRVISVDGETVDGVLKMVDDTGIKVEEPSKGTPFTIRFDDIRSAKRNIDI